MVRDKKYFSEPAFMQIRHQAILAIFFGLPLAGSAQDVGDTIQVDSSVVSAGYDLAGITVRVARPVLTTGGASAVVLELIPWGPSQLLRWKKFSGRCLYL